MNSVAGDYDYLELITNSKSGSFFFYSHDHKYIIKNMKVSSLHLGGGGGSVSGIFPRVHTSIPPVEWGMHPSHVANLDTDGAIP